MTNILERRISPRVGFIDPFDSRPLLAYYEDIFRWHGFIRFVGLPFFRDDGNVPIAALFVEPNLAKRRINADHDPIVNTARLSEDLIKNDKLVILGDPGAGKSTLVSWIAWQLTSPSARELAQLSGYVPVPVVLRELDLGSVSDAASLLASIVQHPSLRRLKESRLIDTLLKHGQVYFLLDGLDEVPSGQRRSVVDAVRSALRKYSRCRWLITSRVVGYDENAVDFRTQDALESIDRKGSEIIKTTGPADQKVERRYVAPLSDEQMELFAQRWFQGREASPETAREFIAAVRTDPQTRQLARLPNLLTLMAIVYRVQLHLPHGRALLYDKITDAYLETIDASKRLPSGNLSLGEKKRILSYIAFQMQRSRGDGTSAKREILINSIRLRELMTRFVPAESAAALIQHLGARSGIIQQRGPDQFAFTHLSFQDYFAALFVADQVTSPRWLRTGAGEPGTSREDLLHYFSDGDWGESLILLFEMLASRSGWSETLLTELFGEAIALPDLASAAVVAGVVSNPHTELSREVRTQAMNAAWLQEITAWQQDEQFLERQSTTVSKVVAAADRDVRALIWESFTTVVDRLRPERIALIDCPVVSSIDELRLPSTVRYLFLDGCPVSDTTSLVRFHDLAYLSLARTPASDVVPLGRLTNLFGINLSETPVTDIRPLRHLPYLTMMYLSRSSIDPSQLAGFTSVEGLTMEGLPIDDIGFLEQFSELALLDISSSGVTDLGPIRRLSKLEFLAVDFTSLSTVDPVQELVNLTGLYIAHTGVSSLEPIRELRKLTTLSFAGTAVSDIGVIRDLTNLRRVWFSGTNVSDIEPLFALPQLEFVNLPSSVSASDRERLRARFPNLVVD
jgi:internalin A